MKNFAIIGGDLRIIKLANMLIQDNNKVYTYGLEESNELNTDIIVGRNITETVKNAEIVIGPIPFSSDGKNINTPFSSMQISIEELVNSINGKKLIAGAIKSNVYNMINDKNIEIIDIMNCEEMAILNTIATAEGTIEIAMANTQQIIQRSEILILGFGRVGKVLAQKFSALLANVTCAVRKPEDMAWIYTYGYRYIDINQMGDNLKKYQVIINTVPYEILTEEKIQYIDTDCLVIDLASRPGGVNGDAINKRGIKFIWALALPGKVAAVTTAKFIKSLVEK